MAKLSIVIPARNEQYLVPTVEDIFRNARGEVEVVAVLEGYEPPDWKATQTKYPYLHTIYHNEPRGMRASINEGVASAISRGAKFILKSDAHCCFAEGFDEALKADCDKDWVVIPRRKRLDPITWTLQDVGKPDIDYHYLSFPDDPADFGGPGLNGKVWYERCKQRAAIEIDEEMSSQGSGWFMHATYFNQLELMDEASYGKFWNEFQEIGLKCWLSGGQVMVNKRTYYAHWHKGKAGRGYSLPESWLKEGRNHTMKWLYNDAWAKQTLPFKTLIERFWPVPTWPEDWEERVYGQSKSKVAVDGKRDSVVDSGNGLSLQGSTFVSALKIHFATYGIGPDDYIDVTPRVRELVSNDSLDLEVGNSPLGVGNPFRGKLKQLTVTYSYDGNEPISVTKAEREWLVIGSPQRTYNTYESNVGKRKKVAVFKVSDEPFPTMVAKGSGQAGNELYKVKLEPQPKHREEAVALMEQEVEKEYDQARNQAVKKGLLPPMTATALTDYLIRKFVIPSHRLRGPMPIELRDFHRDDLAQLFAELGFTRGAEIGVAEGKYSEVLLKANPSLNLLLVDPWHAYSNNPQNKSKEKHEFAYNETKRKTAGYNVTLDMRYSMDAVRDVPDGSLDFVYADGHHGFDFVMQDLIEWSKRVRSGGIVAGDDLLHLDPKRWGAGPIEAVYAYTKAHGISPWFICNAHRSVDYFWVKP